jgi:PKD repeat protein
MLNFRPSAPRTPISLYRMLALLVMPVALLMLARPATAQTSDPCDRAGCGTIRDSQQHIVCFTPATPAPSTLWGSLQPADTGALPPERDTTNFNEVTQAYFSRNWFYGMEIQNGWILAGLAHGVGIWDARTNPAQPTYVTAKLYSPGVAGVFPYIPGGESSKIVFGGISAPDDTIAALAGYNGAGLLVIDLSTKTSPRAAYQNADITGESVYATTLAGTRYAFMASSGGLRVYNLDKAITYSACLENATSAGHCPGVLVETVTTAATPAFVHGVGNFIVTSFGSGRGFQVFDVTNPLAPVLKLTALRDTPVQGVAIWNQGSTYYVGARLDGNGTTLLHPETAIYDVSCVTGASGCSGVSSPLSALSIDTHSGSEYLTSSLSGSTPFLYVGGDAPCPGADGLQHEWLLNVSNPANPTPVGTEKGTTPESAYYNSVLTSMPVDYWSYYYRATPTGFNLVSPRAGKFLGNYFYRAARSIFDIHKLVGNVAPSADFSFSPAAIYPGTPVAFSDLSTGAPTTWSWSFQDGTPSSSVAENPQVTFSSAGTKSVSLIAGNASGPGSVTKSVVVLPPTPQIGGITVSPPTPSVCQPVTFTATGVTGQPTLAYSWGITNSTQIGVPVSSSTSSLTWDTTGLLSGAYTATVTVTNGAGTATKSVPVTLSALQTLGFNGANGAPTNDAFSAGTVQFHSQDQGATAWSWNFGDGQGFRAYTTDPVNGPSPSFSYTQTGTYSVQVKIKNCVQAEITSAVLSVTITQTTPLAALFQPVLFCEFQQCFATTNVAITFNDLSTGAQLWDYDWSHNSTSAATCNFTDANHTAPVTSHTYTTAGDFYPCLRVRRTTGEQNTYVSGDINVASGGGGGGGGGGNTASIIISGVVSGQINQAYTFTATSSGCTPTTGAWVWAVGDGTISGASTGTTISVAWPTAGVKTVSVTNSGCSGVTGTDSVTISSSGGGGGGGTGGTLVAHFSFSPSAPAPGGTVSFDASASSGNPTAYSWDFGDGTKGTGVTATHAYTVAGSYVIKLDVEAPSTGCPFAPCVADATTTQTIVVVGAPPPPPVSADYTSTVTCVNIGGFDECPAQTGTAVTFTAVATDATTYSWTFGDGATATTPTVSHTWAQPGSYPVTLTTTKGTSNSSKTRTFNVTGAPPPTVKSVVLPWIAQTRGALVQSSDLYVHNPGATPMTVLLEFRKRGLPESNPPQATETIAPGATLYVPDVLGGLFNRQNVAGFVSLTVQGNIEPVITSYNTTTSADGQQFGQTIGGVSMSGGSATAAAADPTTPQVQQLVGLINDSERLAYFGISNPSENPANYHLRFFDKTGKLIAESSQDLTVSRFGQRQFQAEEIQSTFGISNQDDYRVEVETTTAGGSIIPYASNLRLASQDPSFIEAGSSTNSKSYLLGVLSAPGSNGSLWQSDLLLSNIDTNPVNVSVTFTNIGLNSVPTKPLAVTLQPGETQRLQNVVAGSLGVTNGIGLITVTSTSASGVFPIVQGESYDNSNPAKQFGQSMSAVSDTDAAGVGQAQYMVGLRQDATHRTTFWLFNPGTAIAQYDLVYRGLDGSVIATTKGVQLGAGKLRQFSPNQLPLPAGGVTNGFTIQVVVNNGTVLSAAQVVNNATNDPSYILGAVR